MESRPATLRSRRVCRFCLTEAESLSYIHDKDIGKPFTVPLPLQIMSCVAIEVYPADGMPQMICTNCRWNLDRAYKFKMQCKRADEALRNYPTSGSLPRAIIPSSNNSICSNSSDQGMKRNAEIKVMNDQSKKPRMDNGEQREMRERKVQMQKQEDHSNEYEEQVVGDQDNDSNMAGDDSVLEPGEIRVHACDQCNRTFSLQQSLQLHIQQAHRDRNFKCTECDRMFFTKYDLQKHMQTHTEEKPFACSVCNKQFTRANLLQRHEKIHREEIRYACSHCEREFFSREDLEKHEDTAHKAVKPYQCNICSKRFTYKQGLERHEMLHNEDRSFICEYCKEAFRTSNKLARHLQTHAGHRPYVCKMCPRTFLLSHHLTRHMRTHDVEKNHHCEDCGKSFKRKESLDVHQLTHSKRTGMGLTCTVCQESCRNRADYVTHIKQHIEAGEKMGPDGLAPDNKDPAEMDSDYEEKMGQYSDSDDDYRPPAYITKKLPKPKRIDEEEDMDRDDEQGEQIVYVRSKDGNLTKKTIKTLMPIQRRDSSSESPTKVTSPQIGNKSQLKSDENVPKARVDETEAQVQKIVASVFKEHKIPLKNTPDQHKESSSFQRQVSQATNAIKEERNDTSSPGPKAKNAVKVIKKIIVKKASTLDSPNQGQLLAKDQDIQQTIQSQVVSQVQSQQVTNTSPPAPKVTKRVIVRRIIRQGDTTREVIMNPDGTIIDPAELAKLPQGNVVKRVIVKKPQQIAAILQDDDSKDFIKTDSNDLHKLIKSTTAATVAPVTTTSNVPKVVKIQNIEPNQKPQIISKDDQDTKVKLEQLEKRVEQQRLVIEELQAKKQQEYENDEMLPERHDESDDEQQLPLKRVFVKRKQCIYDEEKEYNDSLREAEGNKAQMLVEANSTKNNAERRNSNSEEKKNSLNNSNAKVIVIKSNEPTRDVEQMSRELCDILDSTDNVVKMQETVLNNLTEITSIESQHKMYGEHEKDQIAEPMEQEINVSESQPEAGSTTLKFVVTTSEEDGIKLEMESQNDVVHQVEENVENMETQIVMTEGQEIYDPSVTISDGEKSQNVEESIIELQPANETINLNETTDSRDSLEDKLSQMEG